MARTKNASEFKAQRLALIDEVAATGEPIVVQKRGKAVARVVPAPSSGTGAPQGRLKGSVTYCGDIVSPTTDPADWDAESADRGHPAHQ